MSAAKGRLREPTPRRRLTRHGRPARTIFSGHLGAATDTASTLAARLDSDVPAHDPESLSVYGSILLRGAIATAQRHDRQTAHGLLAEADAGRRLGADANLRWTALGPTNVKMHRVHIAVTLGDAGTAIEAAVRINLDQVPVTERKARLLIDTARAFRQYGKHEKRLPRAASRQGHRARGSHRPARGPPVPARSDHRRPAERSARGRGFRLPTRAPPVTQPGRVLSVIACGAGPASEVGTLVKLAQQRGWTV